MIASLVQAVMARPAAFAAGAAVFHKIEDIRIGAAVGAPANESLDAEPDHNYGQDAADSAGNFENHVHKLTSTPHARKSHEFHRKDRGQYQSQRCAFRQARDV